MVQDGREHPAPACWIATAPPGPALMATAIGVNRTGDRLRDGLDPALRGE